MAKLFGIRKAWIGKSKRGVTPHWLRPMDQCFDAVACKVLPDRIAIYGANYVILKNVALI